MYAFVRRDIEDEHWQKRSVCARACMPIRGRPFSGSRRIRSNDDVARSVANALQVTLGVGDVGRAPGMTRKVAAYEDTVAHTTCRSSRSSCCRSATQLGHPALLWQPLSSEVRELSGFAQLVRSLGIRLLARMRRLRALSSGGEGLVCE